MEFKEVAYWIIGIELVAILFLAYKIVYATAFRRGSQRGKCLGYFAAKLDDYYCLRDGWKQSIGLLGEVNKKPGITTPSEGGDHGNQTGDTPKTKQ